MDLEKRDVCYWLGCAVNRLADRIFKESEDVTQTEEHKKLALKEIGVEDFEHYEKTCKKIYYDN